MFIRTLRFKLALLYLVVFGIIQTALCVGILLVRERELWHDFDLALIDRAEFVADSIEASLATSPEQVISPAFLSSPRFTSFYVQVRSPEGRVLGQSANLGEQPLPWLAPAVESGPSRPLEFSVFEAELGAGGVAASQRLRMLTYRHLAPSGQVLYLQVARAAASVDDAVADIRRLFLFAIPQGLLVAGAASWFAARRSLAPIGTIVREAKALSASDLSHRIRQPSGKDEVAEMVSVLNQLLERLERAFQGQERFIADVSHELKTPLAVLRGEADVLLQRERSLEDYLHYVASVQDELRRLTRIVDSLLMLARADSGLPLPDAAPVSINEVVADTVQRCEPAASQRHVRVVPLLAMAEHDDAAPVVLGDPDLLVTVLSNLVRNAIRFSPVGDKVEVCVSTTATEVIITVRDHGPGISPAYIDQVFDRFFRPPHEGRLPGTGLGLAISRAMVEMHHGSILAVNPLGGGCELVVRLPRMADAGAGE